MSGVWVAVVCCVTTLALYAGSRAVNARLPSPLTNPVVVATPCVIVVLVAAGIDYPTYREGAQIITLLLGPATVALAVPLYKHRATVAACAPAAIAGMACGGFAAVLAAVALARLLALDASVVHAMSIKSATAPIAVQIAPIVGTDASLSAVLAIGTGMCGALIGPWLLNLCAVRDPLCRGLALGSISHGIGTTQAAAEGELQGAVAAAAMGCSAVLVALAAPRLLPLLT